MRQKTAAGIDEYRPPDTSNRINSRWTHDELLLAVQGKKLRGIVRYTPLMAAYSASRLAFSILVHFILWDKDIQPLMLE